MQAQHHGIDARVEALTPTLTAWQAAPTKATGERLATLVDRFTAALCEHLDLEEREVLPLASRHVTKDRVGQPGEHGSETMRSSELGRTVWTCVAAPQ